MEENSDYLNDRDAIFKVDSGSFSKNEITLQHANCGAVPFRVWDIICSILLTSIYRPLTS